MHCRLLLFLALPLASALAGDAPIDRATLRGLGSVNVVVDPVDPALEKEGITQAALQSRLAGRVSDAGVKVDEKSPNFLGLRVMHVRDGRRGPYALSLNLGAYQKVALARDANIRTSTETWGVESVLIADGKALYRACMDSVDELADRFVAAWRAVNGGKGGS